ncbi:MAG TPA: hypothetical protein P5267_01885 [Patescibacteria group bacterium]|nr:hypothetical protein [Patescibacteria group bacterium]
MKKNLVSIILALSFITLIPSAIFAATATSKYALNEQTKECSEFFTSDECIDCQFPSGWQIIEESQCPTGYKEIKKNSVCLPKKDSFCCTVQHSGANGDCEDVVVNEVEQKCAFVEDINKCGKLPQNWKQAEETKFWGKACPSLDYEWLNSPLNCAVKIIEKDNNHNQQEINNSDKEKKSNISSILGISAVIIIFLTILWFFLIKRR